MIVVAAATPGPRPWVWLAALGLLVAALLIYRAGRAIFRALPDAVQADAGALAKRHARLGVTGGVILLWTTVYALYSLGLPTVVTSASTRRANATAAAPRSPTTTSSGGLSALGPAPVNEFGAPVVGGTNTDAPPPTVARPAPPAPPAPTGPDCSAAAVGDAVRQAQTLAEMLLGRPAGADFGLLVEALAGCGDPSNALLSLLSPIDDVLDTLGVPAAIDLPGLPELPPITLPEAVAAPFRPYVFQVCSQVQAELVTVGAVAPAIHLNYEDLSALFRQVDTVCKVFAKA
ncbi:MAG TPA: hypothetical protein VFB78_04970 [Acidimicrobiales bacterium]|nr:hypothetical protein [Acidimicrobiales bacterium]